MFWGDLEGAGPYCAPHTQATFISPTLLGIIKCCCFLKLDILTIKLEILYLSVCEKGSLMMNGHFSGTPGTSRTF